MGVLFRRRAIYFLLSICIVYALALIVSVIRYVNGTASKEASPSQKNSDELIPLRFSSGGGSVLQVSRTRTVGESSTIEFGSCLLLMDDSHRLAEWISYHYFALPLSYLVVAIDPYSRADTTHMTINILDQWKPYLKNITVWINDDAYGFNKTGENSKGIPVRANQHRLRQRYFYRSCTLYLKMIASVSDPRPSSTSSVWTTYHDIDEYISLNSLVVQNATSMMSSPHGVSHYLSAHTRSPSNKKSARTSPSKQIESITSAHPCIGIPRILYSAVESFEHEPQGTVVTDLITAPAIDLHRFETMRWRYRTREDDIANNLKGKAMVDITKLSFKMVPQAMMEVHRPIAPLCPPPMQYRVGSSPIIIHHYLGSWEWYSYRSNDSRRGQEKNALIWKYRSTLQGGGANDELRGWLKGFIHLMGEDVAGALLASAGILLSSVENQTDSNMKVNSSSAGGWDVQDPKYLSSIAKKSPGYSKFLLEQSQNS
jgi:hypothetical protein